MTWILSLQASAAACPDRSDRKAVPDDEVGIAFLSLTASGFAALAQDRLSLAKALPPKDMHRFTANVSACPEGSDRKAVSDDEVEIASSLTKTARFSR